tara:strand:+ start:605 stop:1618 length:1014 start_codon:yes stop_codon:yes gene_type:complete
MNAQKLQFSVIIPTFNPDFKIFKTIDSIVSSILYFKKINQIEYEIIIINDGGKKIDSKINDYDKYLNIFNLKKNKGVGYAREIGARIAKYETIFYIDSDVIIEPNTLSTMYKEHKSLKDAGSVGALQSYKNLNSNYSSKFVCAKSCYGFEDKPELLEFSAIHSECCVINKLYLREIGGWNFYKKSGGEEFELGHKIILSGKKNYLTKKTRYSTYYENILSRCSKIVYRTSNYLPIFFSRKKFETKGAFATKDQFLSVLLTLITLLFLVIFFFTKISLIYILPIILLNLIIEFDFLRFSKKIYSLKDIPFFLIGIYLINLAIFIGFISGIFNLIKGNK